MRTWSELSGNKPAIRVRQLGKRYTLGGPKERYSTFRDAVVSSLSAPFRHQPAPEDFWALKDVSFDVMPGEVIGIIGRNGAGKSTLLKILSRITPPTEGCIELRGRVGSLLEVGTGFHPELTGRENIFLSGAILGMRKKEIEEKLDTIVRFSEIGEFLDTPAKRYSSGMYVRLAFAVAAHLEPEILLVDEVLAVGDASFRKKSLGKMGEVAREGRTVLFVSHNMGAIQQLCKKTILIDKGRIALFADSARTVEEYYQQIRIQREIDPNLFRGSVRDVLRFRKITINSMDISASQAISARDPIEITVSGEAKKDLPDFKISFSILRDGIRLFTQSDLAHPALLPEGSFESSIVIPGNLLRPGEYSVSIGGYRDGLTEWVWGKDLGYFRVSPEWNGDNLRRMGLINIPHQGSRKILGPEK